MQVKLVVLIIETVLTELSFEVKHLPCRHCEGSHARIASVILEFILIYEKVVFQELRASQVCNGGSVAVHLVREVASCLVQQRDIGGVPLNLPRIARDGTRVDHLFVLKG